MTDNKLWQNRKEKKEWARRLQSDDPGLEVFILRAPGLMPATVPIMLRSDRSAIQSSCGGSTVSQLTCIAWRLARELRGENHRPANA